MSELVTILPPTNVLSHTVDTHQPLGISYLQHWIYHSLMFIVNSKSFQILLTFWFLGVKIFDLLWEESTLHFLLDSPFSGVRS